MVDTSEELTIWKIMTSKNVIIAPSILSANFCQLQSEVDSVAPYADWLQVDVMDGHFVPNLSFGAPVIKDLKTELPLDIHLMVSNPADRIAEFAALSVAHITFHAEVVEHKEDRLALIKAIRDTGATAGIAINPETPLNEVGDVLDDIDLLLVMSVHPGFGGQSFIEHVLSNVKAARHAKSELMIQMDGGIDDVTAPKCIEAGANNLVSGSYIFKSNDREAAISRLRGSWNSYISALAYCFSLVVCRQRYQSKTLPWLGQIKLPLQWQWNWQIAWKSELKD